jgi:hypothetical protein
VIVTPSAGETAVRVIERRMLVKRGIAARIARTAMIAARTSETPRAGATAPRVTNVHHP